MKNAESEVVASTAPRQSLMNGLDRNFKWKLCESDLLYSVGEGKTRKIEDKKVLYRSDTGEQFDIVSSGFIVNQPAQVKEWFEIINERAGLEIDHMFQMFGGRNIVSLSEVHRFDTVPGDTYIVYLMLVATLDGGVSTQSRAIAVRQYSNAIIPLTTQPLSRATNKTVFNPVTFDPMICSVLNLAKSFQSFAEARIKERVADREIREFFESHLHVPGKREQTWGVTREVKRLTDLAIGGSGTTLNKNTNLAILMAAAEYFTHGTGKREQSAQLWDALMGSSATSVSSIKFELSHN